MTFRNRTNLAAVFAAAAMLAGTYSGAADNVSPAAGSAWPSYLGGNNAFKRAEMGSGRSGLI